jgi:hypothetical protein
MQKKEKRELVSLYASEEAVKNITKFAEKLGISRPELIDRVFKHDALIQLFLKKFAYAKVNGPFVRKKEDKLERYFLVDDTEVVVDQWDVVNIEDVTIE